MSITCSKLFVSEHNLWFNIYGYGGPPVNSNIVGMATVKCQICKQSESCCSDMVSHLKNEHNIESSVINRVDGKYHDVSVRMRFNVMQDFDRKYCNTVILRQLWKYPDK